MSLRGRACIVGAYEHPTRKAPDRSTAQLHAEVAFGALQDAGLTKDDVDGYFCAGDAPGMGPLSVAEYLGLDRLRHVDSTDIGGSSYIAHVAHAAAAIALGRCNVALITLAGRPRSEGQATGTATRAQNPAVPDDQFEIPMGRTVAAAYAMCAMRHMHEFGTTGEQLAWIKVAASQHAQHNEHAMLRKPVTVQEVVESPLVADPLHRLDCCVISDGGGRADRRTAGDRAGPEAPGGDRARHRRGAEAPCRRLQRPDLLGRALLRRARLRGGRRDAGRHPLRQHL
jgi:acetyl-CoA C-acetyltransferase